MQDREIKKINKLAKIRAKNDAFMHLFSKKRVCCECSDQGVKVNRGGGGSNIENMYHPCPLPNSGNGCMRQSRARERDKCSRGSTREFLYLTKDHLI